MSNTVTVSVPFSFKGETFYPSVIIDLDLLIKHKSSAELGQEDLFQSIYPLLAASINIDTYSYAYEIMQAGTAVYSEPTGLAVNHLDEGKFDFHAFYKQWNHNKDLSLVQAIAEKYLSVPDLEQQPQLRDALLEAYSIGKNSK